jgi:hypothetical protein
MLPIKPDIILEFAFEDKILDIHFLIPILTLHLLTILSTPPAVIILLFVGLRKTFRTICRNMSSTIFSINQTSQRILASLAQGGGGWSSTPPKFALDQKKAPLDLFNAHRWAAPTPLGTTALEQL